MAKAMRRLARGQRAQPPPPRKRPFDDHRFDINIILCDPADMATASADREAARLALVKAYERKEAATAAITQAVVDARALKITWKKIAAELGVEASNATRKYKPYADSMKPKNLWENEPDPELPALAALRRAVTEHSEAEPAEVAAVAVARSHDVTWKEIAEAVHMKEPNAFVKYGAQLEEKRVVTVRATPSAEAE